jgi:acetyl-CoA carboxylase / biotin carboxylase 1
VSQVVAIANDITYNSGSFGPREDAVFYAMTIYALQHKLPLVYLAANSGARVGLASEIKACLQVPRTFAPGICAVLQGSVCVT